jgi:hypothetical protein
MPVTVNGGPDLREQAGQLCCDSHCRHRRAVTVKTEDGKANKDTIRSQEILIYGSLFFLGSGGTSRNAVTASLNGYFRRYITKGSTMPMRSEDLIRGNAPEFFAGCRNAFSGPEIFSQKNYFHLILLFAGTETFSVIHYTIRNYPPPPHIRRLNSPGARAGPLAFPFQLRPNRKIERQDSVGGLLAVSAGKPGRSFIYRLSHS